MKTKGDHPIQLLTGRNASSLVRLYFEFNQLKHLYRQGWLQRGIPLENVESVAEHTLGVALLTLWLAEAYFPAVDADKALRMALVHDFGEIYAGDLTPNDRVAAGEKAQRERAAVQEVLGKLVNGQRYLALWEEFETGETPEARLVRQVDRLEMALQASVYRGQGYGNLEEFFATARAALTDPPLTALFEELEALRT